MMNQFLRNFLSEGIKMNSRDDGGKEPEGLWDTIHKAAERLKEEQRSRLNESLDRPAQNRIAEEALQRLISDDEALRKKSDDELTNLILLTQSEIKKINDDIVATDKIYKALPKLGKISSLIQNVENSGFNESIRKREVLLSKIKVIQEARIAAASKKAEDAKKAGEPRLTPDQERILCQEEIRKLQRDKAADLERMHQDGADDESIRYRENMWDDARRRKENHLRKLMGL
jgi:hypothetical protein